MSNKLENKPVVILGASGLGKVAFDIFESNKKVVYCFLDDDAKLHGESVGDISILGSTDDDSYLNIIGKDCDAFVAVDEASFRNTLTDLVKERCKVMPINALHQNASISSTSEIGYGNLVNSGAVINSFAKVSNHCIIHSGAVIDYEAELEDFVQIGVGAKICSGVKIGKGAFIGAGAIVVSGVTVGPKARIGAGSVVIKEVKKGETVFGNPAAKV